jgi:hypothetical protein
MALVAGIVTVLVPLDVTGDTDTVCQLTGLKLGEYCSV